jgi:hypothetical protein
MKKTSDTKKYFPLPGKFENKNQVEMNLHRALFKNKQ